MSDFKPNIAAGSIFALEVKKISAAKITISQDNGEVIVIHHDDVMELIKLLECVLNTSNDTEN